MEVGKLSQLYAHVSLRSYFSVDAEKILIGQRNLSKPVFTFLPILESDQEIFSPSLRGANKRHRWMTRCDHNLYTALYIVQIFIIL